MDSVYIILVGTQLPENIGSVARAMGNFGFLKLRLAGVRCPWPNDRAYSLACHANAILDDCQVYPNLEDAVADLNYLYATTARNRFMEKPVTCTSNLASDLVERSGNIGLIFGPEDDGLTNKDMRLVDQIISIPTYPLYSSMNLAQAVCVVCYTLSQVERNITMRYTDMATKYELDGMLKHLESELESKNFFQIAHKKEEMIKNISATFTRVALTSQEVRTMRGIIRALAGVNREQ